MNFRRTRGREDPEGRVVCGPFDRWRHDLDPEDTVDGILIDAFDRGSRREADGEADAGEAQNVRRRPDRSLPRV